jgi:hypothetical protein
MAAPAGPAPWQLLTSPPPAADPAAGHAGHLAVVAGRAEPGTGGLWMGHLLSSPVVPVIVASGLACALIFLADRRMLRRGQIRIGLIRLTSPGATWLLRECDPASQLLVRYGHQMTWEVRAGDPVCCIGSCGQCQGSAVMTLTGTGQASLEYRSLVSAGDVLAYCEGRR